MFKLFPLFHQLVGLCDISSEAQDVEFRVMSEGIHGDETDKDRVSVVVDYVKLSRRLFC